jgi:hypothetical protein
MTTEQIQTAAETFITVIREGGSYATASEALATVKGWLSRAGSLSQDLNAEDLGEALATEELYPGNGFAVLMTESRAAKARAAYHWAC